MLLVMSYKTGSETGSGTGLGIGTQYRESKGVYDMSYI